MDMNKGFPDESVRIQYEKLLLLAPISARIPTQGSQIYSEFYLSSSLPV